MTRTEAVEAAQDEDLLFLDPESLDAAILGVSLPSPGRPALVIYDHQLVIGILGKDMDRESAEEFFEFNTLGAWVGNHTPIFLNKLVPEAYDEAGDAPGTTQPHV